MRAWKIGNQLRFNDDGEPSGTAGRPILATIEGNELTNILVIVNRWFGGIKLGTGGWCVLMVAVRGNACHVQRKNRLSIKNLFTLVAISMNGRFLNMN